MRLDVWPWFSSLGARWGRVLLLAWVLMSGDAMGGDSSDPVLQGYKVPGRNPDSQMPWEFFMGSAAHRIIAYIYGVNHPESRGYYNSKSIEFILEDAGLGNASLLPLDEIRLRPDITDVSLRCLFEIKPWGPQALQEGRQEARRYLGALNRVVVDGRHFVGGTDFQGEILIRFAGGQYIWRLEWRTPESGVSQYRWERSQQRFDSEQEAYRAGQWVDLSVEEMQQYGGWVAQAVEGMISRREKVASVGNAVGVVIEIAGGFATAVLWNSILGQMGGESGSQQQPPAQGGGKLIPFPVRPPPSALPAQIPAAAGMALPR